MSVHMITCPTCGNQMPADARFCPNCGHANPAFANNPQPIAAPTVKVQTPPDYSQAPLPMQTQALGSYTPPALQYQYQSQVGVAGITQRDATVALLLELIGYVGILGIGHMYGGRLARGIILMLGWWFYWGIVIVLAITVVFAPVACFMAILWPVVPILSGFWIRNDILRDQGTI
jgi:hypothetical protein